MFGMLRPTFRPLNRSRSPLGPHLPCRLARSSWTACPKKAYGSDNLRGQAWPPYKPPAQHRAPPSHARSRGPSPPHGPLTTSLSCRGGRRPRTLTGCEPGLWCKPWGCKATTSRTTSKSSRSKSSTTAVEPCTIGRSRCGLSRSAPIEASRCVGNSGSRASPAFIQQQGMRPSASSCATGVGWTACSSVWGRTGDSMEP